MKILFYFILPLLFLPTICLGQSSEYEGQLASYITKFKYNADDVNIRNQIMEDVYQLHEQVEVHLKFLDYNSKEYDRIAIIGKRIYAFYDYITTLFNGFIEFELFVYINGLLDIYPRLIDKPNCSIASFYEIEIGKYKAIMVHNKLKPTRDYSKNYYSTIRVEYHYDNGSGSLNVGGNMVRCVIDNDDGNQYNKIVIEKCAEIK